MSMSDVGTVLNADADGFGIRDSRLPPTSFAQRDPSMFFPRISGPS